MESILKDREKQILELRYGLLNGVCKTQREIADMWVYQIICFRIEKELSKAL